MLSNVSSLIKSVTGIMSLLPGIGLIVANLETPPEIGDVYGAMVAIVGFLCIVATQAASPLINRLSWPATLFIVVLLLVAGGATLLWYKHSYDSLVRSYSYEYEQGSFKELNLVLPLKVDGKLAEDLASPQIQGNWGLLVARDPEGTQQRVSEQNTSAHAVLLGKFLLLFCCLIGALTLAAWRAAADMDKRQAGPS